MMNQALFSSKTDKHNTDPAVVADLATVFNWDLDVCASGPNVCQNFYTKEDDGLSQVWRGLCWMNPPYGRTAGKGQGIGAWMRKAFVEVHREEATAVVCLVPARTDTRWWQNNVQHASQVTFVKGRMKFGGADNSAPFPNAFVVFGEIREQQAKKLAAYGWTPFSEVLLGDNGNH